MSLVSNVNNVLNSKLTGIFLFGFTGAYKVVTDYQKAPKHDKQNVLLRDSAILTGSAIGLASYSLGRKSFISSPFKKNCSQFLDNSFEKLKTTTLWKKISKSAGKYVKKPIELGIKNAYNIGKDCLDNTLMVSSGILGGIGTDYLLQITHAHNKIINKKMENNAGITIPKPQSLVEKEILKTPIGKIKKKYAVLNKINKPKQEEVQNTYTDPFSKFKIKIKESEINNDINNLVDTNTQKNILSNITNMPEMKIFNNTMIGLQSFEIAEEKTFKDKLKHTTKNLLTNTLVPMFFLSLSSNLTKGMKGILRAPIVFTTMVAGTMAANKKLQPQIAKLETSKKIVY